MNPYKKVYHLVGILLSSVLRHTRHCILKLHWLPELWRTQHLPILPTPQHTPTFSTPDVTRIPTSGREGWDSPVRKRGKETERDRRKRDGKGGEGEESESNTNCFVQLHKTRNPIPRQWNGMRPYTQDCVPPNTSHCGVCVQAAVLLQLNW